MKNLTILLATLISSSSFSQNFDKLMVNRRIDCSDISYNCGLYFQKYIEENKLDSAFKLLNYWETKCGLREPLYRAKILLSLKAGTFSDSILTEGIINNIFNYQSRMDLIKYSSFYNYDNYKSYYGYIPPGQEFDNFTRILAIYLKTKYSAESTEYLLCEFYGDNYDTIFSKIQTDKYQTSILTKRYNEVVESYLKMSEYHMSLITGIWIPTGGLKKIGYHPEIGFQLGIKRNKMNYDVTLSLKFINAQNKYLALNPKSDSMEFTNHFFGGYIGLDVGRDVFSKNGHEIQVLGGIAFDGFDTFKDDDNNDTESSSVNSYNFNFGIGYRYYISNTFYIGIRAKYNLVDYSLNNRINFTGNPFTLQLIVGGVDNAFRNKNLMNLKYKLRK